MSRHANEFALLDELVTLATVDLFHTLGVTVARTDEAPIEWRSSLVASTMGFTARGLRGAITLLLDRPTLLAVYKGIDFTAIDAARDACGEISNMLVGELKGQLRSLGVTAQLGLPVTMAGDNIQLFSPWAGISSWQLFEGTYGAVRLRLDVQFSPDFAFTPDAALPFSAEAGDAFFF